MNTLRTFLLMLVMTGLLVAVGYLAGGDTGMILALILAAVLNLGSYWFSDKLVLAMYHAQPVSQEQAPELYAIIQRLAERDGLPMPRIAIIPDESPNAFATGRDPQHAVVAVTQGLLRILSADEVEGVLAHELSHVHNRDILIGAIAATLAGAIMIVARIAGLFGGRRGGLQLLLLFIFGPIAAMLVQLAISRSREYQADASGAALSGNPEGLAHALAKLEQVSRQRPMANAQPNTSHLFIVNPLAGNWLSGLFSTHPPIAQRIARLEALAKR